MANLILDDGFSPYFERGEQRLSHETRAAPPAVPAERHRPLQLFALDPRTITASGPSWRATEDTADKAA